MTLVWGPSGWEGDFRYTWMPRLRLSMRVTQRSKRPIAKRRHDAVAKVCRLRKVEIIAQLRSGVMSVEALEEKVTLDRPLEPIAAPREDDEAAFWGTVDEAGKRYVQWVTDHPKREASTANNAYHELRRFRDYVHDGKRIGDLPVASITSAMIQAYQRSLVDGKVPANSITNLMSRAGALWNWLATQEETHAQEQRRQARSLYAPFDPEMILRDRVARERFLTPGEAKRLIAATPEQLQFPVGCALYAGLRLNEVLHLQPGITVDLETNSLGVREIQPHFKPKTKRSVRIVPMADELRASAELHLSKYATTTWMTPGFTDESQPLDDQTFRKQFRKVVLAAGLDYGRDIPTGVTFHTLRHSFASHAVMRGVDLYTVAQLLGDSLKTAETTYAHLSRDFKAAAIQKVAAAFRTTEGS